MAGHLKKHVSAKSKKRYLKNNKYINNKGEGDKCEGRKKEGERKNPKVKKINMYF